MQVAAMPPKRKSSAANAYPSKKRKIEVQETLTPTKMSPKGKSKQKLKKGKTGEKMKTKKGKGPRSDTMNKRENSQEKLKPKKVKQGRREKQLDTKQTTQNKQNPNVKTPKKAKEKSPEVPADKKKKAMTTEAVGPIGDLLVDPQWREALKTEFQQKYFQKLETALHKEYSEGKQIFPPRELIVSAFNFTPLSKVKVVILGQDPYHDDNQAMGLSFSIPRGEKIPPSLKNIYKELERDPKIKGFTQPDHGCLVEWAHRGVLLLNATLTVEAHLPNSHAKLGWQTFTDNVIKTVSDRCPHVVFILWGNFAHKKEKLIDGAKHAIIKTAHPSPLSFKKFNACNCFSDCNSALEVFGLSIIDWSL